MKKGIIVSLFRYPQKKMPSVAEELWISIVTAIPTSTEIHLFRVACSSIDFSFSPHAFRSPVDMMDIPYRNKPTPPSRLKSSKEVICCTSPLCFYGGPEYIIINNITHPYRFIYSHSQQPWQDLLLARVVIITRQRGEFGKDDQYSSSLFLGGCVIFSAAKIVGCCDPLSLQIPDLLGIGKPDSIRSDPAETGGGQQSQIT